MLRNLVADLMKPYGGRIEVGELALAPFRHPRTPPAPLHLRPMEHPDPHGLAPWVNQVP